MLVDVESGNVTLLLSLITGAGICYRRNAYERYYAGGCG